MHIFTIENIGYILGEGFEAELETLRSDVKGAARFAEKTTRLAAFHAGADMMQTTCSAGIEEEHITASLMGHLSSHLRWFSALAIKHYPDFAEMPDIRWAHMNKRQEGASGGDFAIVADHSEGADPDPVLRIVLFQAKVAHEPPTISISHRTNDSGGSLSWTPSGVELMKLLARQAGQRLNKAQCEDVRRALATPMAADRYQLEALVRTHFRGQFITRAQRRWCYYSVWRPDMLPQAIELHDVARALVDGEHVRLPGSLTVGQNAYFHDILIEALFHDSDVGLRVPLSQFATFKERIEELLPQIDFLVAARMIGPQLKNTLKATHKLSNSLVRAHAPSPKQAFEPAVNATPDPDHADKEDRPESDNGGLGMTMNSSRG